MSPYIHAYKGGLRFFGRKEHGETCQKRLAYWLQMVSAFQIRQVSFLHQINYLNPRPSLSFSFVFTRYFIFASPHSVNRQERKSGSAAEYQQLAVWGSKIGKYMKQKQTIRTKINSVQGREVNNTFKISPFPSNNSIMSISFNNVNNPPTIAK